MENNRFLKFFTLATIMGMLIASPFFVLGYDDQTTHPALTDEIVDLFNLYYPKLNIDDTDKKSIKEGSINEDTGTRWMHHFYDPIYNRGLWGYSSSKAWALDTGGQAILDMGYVQGGGTVIATVFTRPFDSRTDYSWDRAIYDYVWADKARGLEGLGHILHLLEDASVPDHTRNDAHPAILNLGSPYEFWTKRFTDKTIDGLALSIFNDKTKPYSFKILQESFYSLAKYSNENFFSKDSLPSKSNDYSSPSINNIGDNNGIVYAYWPDSENKNYKLVRLVQNAGNPNNLVPIFDNDKAVMQDYWTHLSKQAVLHGAGVVKLFFEEADKERISKTRLSQNKSLLDKISSSLHSLFGDTEAFTPLVATLPAGAFDIAAPLNISNGSTKVSEQSAQQNTSLHVSDAPMEDLSNILGSVGSVHLVTLETPRQNHLSDSANISNQSLSVSPGFGGGAASNILVAEELPSTNQNIQQNASANNSSTNNGEVDVAEEKNQVSIVPPDTTAPPAPIILEPTDNTIFTTNEIIFRGTAEPLSIISQNLNTATTSAQNNGVWELKLLAEKQGTSTVKFYANDLVGNISSSTLITVLVDTMAPDISLVASACNKSLALDSCLLATSTVRVEWSSLASDIHHFEISCTLNDAQCENFDFKNTKATSTVYRGKYDEGKYKFSAKAFDTSGNMSDEVTKEVTISNRPVIINEIAWAGSAASSADEWIELYNRTDEIISLDNWKLYAKTNGPYISLSGSISPRSYYLMERTDDNTVSNITADLIYGNDGPNWALNNSSEPVTLSYASTTIDETAVCGRGSQWCGGSAEYLYQSMERIDPDVAGTIATNWKSSMDEFIKNGLDAKGKAMNATPKARNSAHYLINSTGSLTSDKTLTKRNSPYLIGRNGLTLEIGKTLTIEPGVVIKFVSPNEPTFWVKGTIKAIGTAENPIVFTSLYDDEYGGDMNSDGICNKTNASSTSACPFVGSWRRIHIMTSSAGSELDHVIVRYGGRWFNDGLPSSMVVLEKTDAVIRNSTFEYSEKHGLQLLGGGGVIEKNIFQNNNVDTESAGLMATGGATIRDNVFNNNYFGLTLQSSTATVENNIFNGNKSYAINVSSGLASFVGNSGNGNGKNGIKIVGQLNATTSPLVMHANVLPYLIGSGVYETLEIPDKSTVDVDAGVVFKSLWDGIIKINGILNINGSAKESVLFAPLAGDNSPSDWWRGINIGKTGILKGGGFTMRRAGLGCPWGTACAGILVEGGKIQIQNARFDNNYTTGVRLSGSVGSTFSDVEFINHNEPKIPANDSMRAIGFMFSDSDIGVGNLLFSNNTLGAYSTNSTVSHLDSYRVGFLANIINSIPPDIF